MADVTVVVPARVTDWTSVRCIIESVPAVVSVIVVDDASTTSCGDLGRARVLRTESSRGPAGARNVGLAEVTTEFVLFLDHDVIVPTGADRAEYWDPLMFHFADESVVLVAPRVRSTPGTSVLHRFEMDSSPLDMGDVPARVAPGSRVSYVPSAALIGRTSTLRDLGGFDESLRYGEDVDLLWRSHAAGFACRYEPMVEMHHEPRSTWTDWLRQRFQYGTAAGALESRHPGSTRPVRMNRWSALVLGLAAAGHPVLATGVAVSTVARLSRRFGSIPERWILSLRLAGRGHLFAARTVLEASVRTWWPITALLALRSRRVRFVVGAFLIVRAVVMWRRHEHISNDPESIPLDPIRTSLAKIADDAAYGTGVWFGAARTGTWECLRPRWD